MSYNIAVTATGGGVGQSILKSLYNTNYNVIALDGESLGAGLYGAKTSYLIPYANDPEYIPRLLEICKKEKIDLLFPGMDAELSILSENFGKFAREGTIIIVSPKNVIELSNDKLLFYKSLMAESGILYENLNDKLFFSKIPKTYPAEHYYQLEYPFIFKPKIGGARSKDVSLISSKKEVIIWLEAHNQNDYISQEYIEGDEYTCGTISFFKGCEGVIIMRRILRDGDTYKCFVEKNDIIEKGVRELINIIKPFGACNVQLRMRDEIPYIFEINARCSGTTAARTLSGFNEPKMIVDYLLKNIKPKYEIKEQTILRYWNELVVPNEKIEIMKKEKHLTGNITKLW